MAGFFKSFGKGLLYIVLFPLILVLIAVYGVYGLFAFIVQLVNIIVLFFSGKSLSSDLEEDIKAKAILNGTSDKDDDEEEEEEKISVYPSDSPVYTTNNYNTPIDEKKPESEPEGEVKEPEIEVKLDD